MTKKRQAPESNVDSTRAKFTVQYKGTIISLSMLQYSMFIRLGDGNKHSSHKLMQHLHTSDPRKEILYLRRKGVDVQDMWVKGTSTIPRHKQYWIDPNECE